MPTSGIGPPLLQHMRDRVDVLEETDSFIVATTAATIVVGNTWVQVTGLVPGPYGYLTDTPDLEISADAASIRPNRKGKHHLLVNAQYVSATADGYFECAIQGHVPDEELWPAGIDRGHTVGWLAAAALAWPEATLGMDASVIWPLVVGDEVTAWLKFVTASGTDTAEVAALIFVTRLGL